MEKRSTFSKVLSGSLLISGTTIGAGMLGIPLVTNACGFIPASVICVVVWLFMLLTGLLLLRATLWLPDHSSYLSISKKFLGRGGEVVTGVMFVFLYYCLMIAYFAAGSHLIADLLYCYLNISLFGPFSILLFSTFFFIIVVIGPKSIDRVNIVLSLCMFALWFVLLGLGIPHVDEELLVTRDFSKMWVALPLLFGAFGYHNIIPSLTSYLKRDKKALRLSIYIGATIPLVAYVLWQWLILGILPDNVIQDLMGKGLPVTFALKEFVHSKYIFVTGQLFALFAIITSVLGVSFSLIDFLADGFNKKAKGVNRIWLSLLTILPPALIALSNPSVFEKALSIAGGFGEAILNGFLPVAVVYSACYFLKKPQYECVKGGRVLLIILAGFALLVTVIEALHLAFD
ncbi:MAG: aromatic amino acid transport family protein [Rhabdochlamydiaceae bacterium]|nr:aromatic amino acid transport family protein [Candidatus Amphrikana amoebophyrae]